MAANSYVIHQRNGQELVNLAEGITDSTTTSLTLIGRKVSYYGEILNENFVHLLENFSQATSPAHPLTGQLWFNSETNVMYVYNGDRWKQVNGVTVLESPPISSDAVGDMWWSTSTEQLFAWTGSTWSLIGPATTSVGGTTGIVADTLTDTFGGNHLVLVAYVEGTPVAVINKDTTFDTRSINDTLFTVKPGFTVFDENLTFNGVAEDSQRLGGISASTFIRDDRPVTLTYGLSAPKIAVGGVEVDSVSNTISVPTGQTFSINYGRGQTGVGTAAIAVDVAGNVTVAQSPSTDLGVATKLYVDSNASGTKTSNNWTGVQTFAAGAFRVTDNSLAPSKILQFNLSNVANSTTVSMQVPSGVTSFTPALSARAANTGITIGNRKRLGRYSQTNNDPGALQELNPDFHIGGVAFFFHKLGPGYYSGSSWISDTNWLPLNGQQVSRTTYKDLFEIMVKKHTAEGVALISLAPECTVTWPSHGLSVNDPVIFTTGAGGVLPASILANTVFYVRSVPTVNIFTISATLGGGPVDTSLESASGPLFVWFAPFGLGDLSATFTLPTWSGLTFGLQYQYLTPYVKALAN